MGLALAIVMLWLAGLCFWLAFHNLDKLNSETATLPGALGALVAAIKSGEKPTSSGTKTTSGDAPGGAVMA